MRLSKLFKLSFVGTLIFSPGMAQQAENVHDQALKVLRGSETNRANTTVSAQAPRGPETRAEREARLKAQAQQAMQERERLQAEKTRQFEEYVKERERLRQQKAGVETGVDVHDKALEVLRQNPPATGNQASPAAPVTAPVTAAPVSPSPVAPPTAAPAPAASAPSAPAAQSTPVVTSQSNEDIQQRALEILRQQRAHPPSNTPAPVSEAEVAPRVVAPTSQTTPAVQVTPGSNNADVHQRALEILRQQQQQPSSQSGNVESSSAPSNTRSGSPAPQDDLKPSPELQRRLDEMQRELQTEQRRSSASPQVDEAYQKDLEQRAREMLRERASAPVATTATSAAPAPAAPQSAPIAPPAATPAPRLDPQTTEIIRRQNQQLSSQANAASSASPALDPGAEARAREILRQQQQVAGSTATAQPPAQTPTTSTAAAQPTASNLPAASAVAGSDVQYSRDLEERARQVLLQRQGQQPAALAGTSAPAPATSSSEASAAANAAIEVSRDPIQNDPALNRVHSRALETLVQVEPGDDGQARLKSKQERLRALTDLYRADRMTPAEYHQRRAQILAEGK